MAIIALTFLLGVLGGAASGALVAYVVFTSLARHWERENPSNLVLQTRVDELQGLVESLAGTWRKETMRRVRSAALEPVKAPELPNQGFNKDQLRREMGAKLMKARSNQ